jgi:outer membrane protein assembly factor BamB
MKHYLPALIIILTVVPSFAGDWPHWRGPLYNGSTDEINLPTKWSLTKGLAWSVALPGPSAATPIICGDRVFISSTDTDRGTLVALCFDRRHGTRLWQHDVAQGLSRDVKSNFAAPSPVTDGRRIVFFYSSGDLVCFDVAGQHKWTRNIQQDYGTFAFQWTFSSSPLLVDDTLYLQVLQRDVPVRGRGFSDRTNDSYLLAMDPETGKTRWRHIRSSKARAESLESFASPIAATLNRKRQLLIIGGDDVTGHDLQTGAELWRWGTWNPKRIGHWRHVPSPVVGNGIVLVCAPKGDPVYGIRPQNTGTLDDKAIAWVSREHVTEISADVPTPAFYKGDFFLLNDLRKHLSRIEPGTGQIKWTRRTPGKDKYRASPLAADDKIYIMDHAGEVAVINADNGKILHTVSMDDPSGRDVVRASICAAYGHLFIRTTDTLYCIGE